MKRRQSSARMTVRTLLLVLAVPTLTILSAYYFDVAPPSSQHPSADPKLACLPCPSGETGCAPECHGSTCTPCPSGDSGTCEPNCSPPCNPTITPLQVGATVTTSSTNATIQVSVSPDLSGTNVTIEWGNSTGYNYAPPSVPSNWTIFLNYLDPSTSYYFEVDARPPVQSSCTQQYTWNTYSGSWTTSSDSMLNIQGTVHDANGTAADPGTVVFASCTVYVASDGSLGSSDPYTWYDYTGTGSNGAYSLAVNNPADLSDNICGEYGFGYVVSVVNGEFCPTSSCVTGNTWPGVWNETVVTYAPQIVDFVLPMNFVGPYIPQVLEFSNAEAGYSSLTFAKATTFDEEQTDDFGATGGAYVGPAEVSLSYQTSTTSSTSYTVAKAETQDGGSLEVLDRFWTSGTVEFNALNRTWSMPAENSCTAACGGEVYEDAGPGFVSSWLYPGSDAPGMYVITGFKNVNLSAGTSETGNVSIKGSVTTTSTFGIAVGITISLLGVGTVTLGANLGSSTSSSKTYSEDLSWTISVPTGGSETCFEVYGQGGSTAANTATIIGIWAGTPGEDGC